MTKSIAPRPVALFSSLALLAIAAPAFAGPGGTGDTTKPIVVRVPASVFKEDSSRLCLNRTQIDKARKSDLPDVMCHTKAEWTDMGVTFVSKR